MEEARQHSLVDPRIFGVALGLLWLGGLISALSVLVLGAIYGQDGVFLGARILAVLTSARIVLVLAHGWNKRAVYFWSNRPVRAEENPLGYWAITVLNVGLLIFMIFLTQIPWE